MGPYAEIWYWVTTGMSGGSGHGELHVGPDHGAGWRAYSGVVRLAGKVSSSWGLAAGGGVGQVARRLGVGAAAAATGSWVTGGMRVLQLGWATRARLPGKVPGSSGGVLRADGCRAYASSESPSLAGGGGAGCGGVVRRCSPARPGAAVVGREPVLGGGPPGVVSGPGSGRCGWDVELRVETDASSVGRPGNR